MRNNRYAAVFDQVCFMMTDMSTLNFQDEFASASASDVGNFHSGGSSAWTKETIMEEAQKYLRGEKQFEELKDLTNAVTGTVDNELNSAGNEEGVDASMVEQIDESLEKVVTATNGTVYLYIPKARFDFIFMKVNYKMRL